MGTIRRDRPARRGARKRVLDVGCGTGALAAALADRGGAKVWGVEPSPEMRDVARARLPAASASADGTAEALPFRDGWFDAVVFSLVIHLVDRDRALGEAARVLAPGGRVVVSTFSHAHFDTYWAADYFPSIREIDRKRFPTEQQLAEELAAAGFRDSGSSTTPRGRRSRASTRSSASAGGTSRPSTSSARRS